MRMNLWTTFLITISRLLEINTNSVRSQAIDCMADVVESIPIGLTFNGSIVSNSTSDTLIGLVSNSRHSIDIASFYWTLLGTDVMPTPDESALKGKELLNAIIDSSKSRSVKIRIAVNEDINTKNSTDLQLLGSVADIRKLNFTRLIGAGILHTKFIVVDNQHFYIGSANMDWRSLTQVKELGIAFTNCQILAKDLLKIFEMYWYLGEPNSTIPQQWPKEMTTEYNKDNPLSISINHSKSNVFLSSSPQQLCPSGRTNDIEAIVSIIRSAKKYIYVSVMDYFPTFLYSKNKNFWPIIDDELKRAVIERRVNVRLLASLWNHTRHSMPLFLQSLSAFNNSKIFGATLQTKLFVVPAFTPFQEKIPFARVNHNKYMVTEETAYIGTNNWSADYFVSTGGVGIAITPQSSDTNLRDKLQNIFERDWSSSYAQNLNI